MKKEWNRGTNLPWANPVLSSAVTSRRVAAAITAVAATTGRDNKRSNSSVRGTDKANKQSLHLQLQHFEFRKCYQATDSSQEGQCQSLRAIGGDIRILYGLQFICCCDVIGKIGI
jgi:hypothetical protein